MNESAKPEEILQKILENVEVGGNLTVGDIKQILKIFPQSHSGSGDNVAGNRIVKNFYLNQLEKYKPKDTPQNIPISNTIKFVGRVETLHELHQKLTANTQLAITAVKGMGGIGKTELAIQYALVHLLVKSYQGGICWLNSREENIGLQIIRFAQTHLDLKLPEDWDLEDQVEFCWSRWHDKKEGNVLIVIDDVTDYSQVEPYLPPQPSPFKVLITTRLDLDEVESLRLDILSESAAIELLSKWVGESKIDQQRENAQDLCQRLGYLPLALNLVGRYIKKRQISVAQMLTRLESKGLYHQSLQIDEKDQTSTLKIQRGVAAAFELSWSELTEDAQKLGCLLSIFALAPIQWQLVEDIVAQFNTSHYGKSGLKRCFFHWTQRFLPKKIYDPRKSKITDLESARIELESLYLIQSEADTYRLHQLIREFFQGKLEQLLQKNNFQRSYVEVMVARARPIPQTPTLDDITTLEPIIPHIAEVANHLTQWLRKEDEEIVCIFTGLVWFYRGQGLYALALPWSEKCVQVTRERLGEEHPNVSTSLNNLALLYHVQGNMNKQNLCISKP